MGTKYKIAQEDVRKVSALEAQNKHRYQTFVKLKTQIGKVSKESKQILSDTQKKHSQNANIDINNGNYETSAYSTIFFGDETYLHRNPNKNKPFQNKVRTQRYTALTWAPLSLLYQFKRASNIYFLIISVLTFLPLSPKNPLSMISTFALVLLFSMLKEAFEDYQRYKQDQAVNNKCCTVFNMNTTQWEPKKWETLVPGQIVKIKKNQEVPADIAILFSSNNSTQAFVDTMNLDGETNLKEKIAMHVGFQERNLYQMQGVIKAEAPNENLEKWEAQISYTLGTFKKQNASIHNLMLRGCYLKNTVFIVGVVVYTGMETKIMQNLKKPRHKVSNMMLLMNKILYTVLAFQLILISCFAGLDIKWVQENASTHPYLGLTTPNDSVKILREFFKQLLVFWVAYSHMIPISLYVIIEVLKLGQASYINKDVEMFDEDSLSFAHCRNSDLIEELGQVEMVFSDKTGTLTQNKMVFKKCQINGIKFGELQPNEKDQDEIMALTGIRDIRNLIKQEFEGTQNLNDSFHNATNFFESLALCNTVICEKDSLNGEITYKASSPDELALVKGSKLCGIQLVSKNQSLVTIYNMIQKSTKEFKVIAQFPFDSFRKRMSVIIKTEEGKIKLLSKGADSVMMERISFQKNRIESLKEIVDEDLYQFSIEGLRTLVFAQRKIKKDEYRLFKKLYAQIHDSQDSSKEEKLLNLYDSMEQNLRYTGCTAIQDKLQEGVSVTISKLMLADIKFFMLTGDKLETAIEIARSCNIIQDDMNVILLSISNKEKIFKKLIKIINRLNINLEQKIRSLNEITPYEQVITIEGSVLSIIMEDPQMENMFFHATMRSRSVVCCRLSPKQKADVVNIFKSRGSWITLAIGDGANDVSMILEAHIGIGIKGKEGTQAVRSSDFAISQFQFLWRLLLYQGRTGYLRVSTMICYYFYKNIILVFTEFYFAFYNGFSGQIFFLDWLPMLYNAIFTSWHCLFALLLEKDLNEHYTFRFPQIYKAGQLNLYFNLKVFWKWIFLGFWHGAVCFYGPMLTGVQGNNQNGQRSEHWFYSTISFTCIVHTVFYKLLLETRHFNTLAFLSGILSLILYYGTLLLAQIPKISMLIQPQALGIVNQLIIYQNFWLLTIGLPLICLFPDFLLKLVSRSMFPTPVDKVVMLQKKDPTYDHYEQYLRLNQSLQIKQRSESVKKEFRQRIIKIKKSPIQQEDSDQAQQQTGRNLKDKSPFRDGKFQVTQKVSSFNKGHESTSNKSKQEQHQDDELTKNIYNDTSEGMPHSHERNEEDYDQSNHDSSHLSKRRLLQDSNNDVISKNKKKTEANKPQGNAKKEKSMQSISLFSVSDFTNSKNHNDSLMAHQQKYMEQFEDLNNSNFADSKSYNQPSQQVARIQTSFVNKKKRNKHSPELDTIKEGDTPFRKNLTSDAVPKIFTSFSKQFKQGSAQPKIEESESESINSQSNESNQKFRHRIEHQRKFYEDEKESISDENTRSKEIEIEYLDEETFKGRINKSKKSLKNDSSKDEETKNQDKRKDQTDFIAPINKDVFKKICAIRSPNMFMIDKTIPQSQTPIDPLNILDKLGRPTSVHSFLTIKPDAFEEFGHPLEKLKITPSVQNLQVTSKKNTKQKSKKYVAKYLDNESKSNAFEGNFMFS